MSASARATVAPKTLAARPSSSRSSGTVAGGEPASASEAKGRLRWPATVFLVAIFIPWLWQIGPLTIMPYRLFLVFTAVPCVIYCLSGKAGKVLASDIAMLLFCLFCTLSLMVLHGPAVAWQPAGMIVIESAGAYFLARTFIRNADDFHAMTRVLFWMVAALLPLAVLEAVLARNVSLELFGRFFPVPGETVNNARWGLRRVQGVFEHPILFGVTCGAIFALVHLVLGGRKSAGGRWFATAIVLFTAGLSLSSGPLTAIVVQVFIVFWSWLLRSVELRWHLLFAAFLAMYGFISLVSNQSVFEFLLTYFSFEPDSAYYRVLIWRFGSDSALNHPLFGVGLGRWDRPSWMPPSIDMFWLYNAVIYGIPAALSMLCAFVCMLLAVGRNKELDPKYANYRVAFMAVMIGYFLVGWTVNFWNSTYCLFLFLLGSGSWFIESRKRDEPAGTDRAEASAYPARGNERRRPLPQRRQQPQPARINRSRS